MSQNEEQASSEPTDVGPDAKMLIEWREAIMLLLLNSYQKGVMKGIELASLARTDAGRELGDVARPPT